MNKKVSTTFSLIVAFLIALTQHVASQPNQAYSVAINGKRISLLKQNTPVLTIDSISFNFESPSSLKVLNNSPDSLVIELLYPKVVDFYGINKVQDQTAILTITHKEGVFHIRSGPRWARHFILHLGDMNDHYFGLIEALYPENKKSPDLRGQTIDVEVNGGMSRFYENFASAVSSFYYNPKGYASYVNSFARGRYQLGINGKTSISHETGKLDWYLFTGKGQDIYQQYFKVIGKPKYVPLWACGPVVWRDENRGGSKEILDDLKQLGKLQIPVTSIMVDRPYSNGAHSWSKMDFNEKFSKPAEWIKQLNDNGVQFQTWIASATFTDTAFPGLLKGSFGYIDLSNPAGKAEFARRLKQNQYAVGVKGHKMDRADELFPQSEEWYDRTPETERKNKYVYLYTKVTDSILRDAWGDDNFSYTRAGIHGSQPYLSGIWGGDVRTSWSGLAANLANAMRASFMGFPNWGTDAIGYLGEGRVPDDLYIRWLQWSVFNGICEIKIDGALGNGEDRAPWHYSPAVQQAFKEACKQRMEWMPHIFSQLNTSHKYGPLMKPLAMVYPEDVNTYSMWDEYLFGNTLLVAPVVSESKERAVYLPEGKWIDFYSGEIHNGPKWVNTPLSLNKIPVFVKANSFQLRGNVFGGNQKMWQKETAHYMDVYYYAGEGSTELDYVDPVTKRSDILKATTSQSQISLTIPAIDFPGDIRISIPSKPKSVLLNGKPASSKYKDGFLIIKRLPMQENVIHVQF